MNLPLLDFLVLDTETTGFVPKVHHVIEVAAIFVKKGEVIEEYSELLSLPEGVEIPLHVQRLTHIHPEDLEGKPTFADTLPKLQSLLGSREASLVPREASLVPREARLRRKASPRRASRAGGGTIIVGQNTPFDLGMLRGEGWDLFERPWIDTSMLASLVFPEIPSYSLGYLSKALKLGHEPEHRALGDTRATLSLLEKCVERLQELPKKDLDVLKVIAAKSSPGYARFFEALSSEKKTRPKWLKDFPHPVRYEADTPLPSGEGMGVRAEEGVVQLLEEPLTPSFLPDLLSGLTDNTWLSVKNIEAFVREHPVPSSVRVLYPPEFLLSMKAVKKFAAQPVFTADEATLAMKLSLYGPSVRSDLPLHGGEHELWKGKLAANRESPEYEKRMEGALGKAALISHQELLSFFEDTSFKIPADFHVVISDASMLEDTATNASSFTCHLPTLRAASEGNALLTKCTDVVELWVEKTRSGQDLRYLAPSDLETKDSLELKAMLEKMQRDQMPEAAHAALRYLSLILDPENLHGRLTWIECWKDGSKTVKSVLEDVGEMLNERLYSRVSTTLLIPKGSVEALRSPDSARDLRPIVPLKRKATLVEPQNFAALQTMLLSIDFPIGMSLDALLDKPEGKIILLMNSKRSIEELYVRCVEELEERGVRFICQGFSGGSGRMQAEFDMAPGPAFLVQTPWTYEGVELAPGTVDRLIIQQLPFDHPSHPVVSRRAARFKDPFLEYSMPRLLHRLFRLARTFLTHASDTPRITVLDDRIRTREYGKTVRKYLESLVSNEKQEKQERLF